MLDGVRLRSVACASSVARVSRPTSPSCSRQRASAMCPSSTLLACKHLPMANPDADSVLFGGDSRSHAARSNFLNKRGSAKLTTLVFPMDGSYSCSFP